MKPYLLFAGETYYPSGGMDDLHSEHETFEAACAAADSYVGTINLRGREWRDRWYQIAVVQDGQLLQLKSGQTEYTD